MRRLYLFLLSLVRRRKPQPPDLETVVLQRRKEMEQSWSKFDVQMRYGVADPETGKVMGEKP